MQIINNHLYTVPIVAVTPDEYAAFGPLVETPGVGRPPSSAVTFIRFLRNVDPGNLAGGPVHDFANATLWCGLSWESAGPTAFRASLESMLYGPAVDSEDPEDVACLPAGPLALLSGAEVELEVTECRQAHDGGIAGGTPAERGRDDAAGVDLSAPRGGGGGGGGGGSGGGGQRADNHIIPVTVSAALGAHSHPEHLLAHYGFCTLHRMHAPLLAAGSWILLRASVGLAGLRSHGRPKPGMYFALFI